jgi:membrane-associated phospholipid phosphatase
MITKIKIKSIYDLISLIVLFLNFYSVFSFQFELLVFNGLALIVHKYIKDLSFGLYPTIFKRPDGAIDCDIFNSGGISSNESGFPSGHMTSVSFYMNAILLKSNKELTIKNIFLYNIPCILMGIARYNKNCHNLIQIIFGYLLGISFAYLLNILYYTPTPTPIKDLHFLKI